MASFLLTFLVAIFPGDPPDVSVVSYVDLIEVNHYFDNEGKPVFDQLIFYDWDDTAARFNVTAWRLLKNPNQIPVRDAATGRYTASWHDGKLLRTVHADRRIETWTQHDPETWERAWLPKSRRPDLVRPDTGR